jgi:hypothetical protein
LANLPFFDIEDEHLVKCDLWVGRFNWPTGSMSFSSWLWIAAFDQTGAAMRRLVP